MEQNLNVMYYLAIPQVVSGYGLHPICCAIR